MTLLQAASDTVVSIPSTGTVFLTGRAPAACTAMFATWRYRWSAAAEGLHAGPVGVCKRNQRCPGDLSTRSIHLPIALQLRNTATRERVKYISLRICCSSPAISLLLPHHPNPHPNVFQPQALFLIRFGFARYRYHRCCRARPGREASE